ncbi:MAG: hypothetical protein QNK19_18390 [Xanthomonadales bacterium]|nr:hypothetical protein [Xanthomonadales bacterium]
MKVIPPDKSLNLKRTALFTAVIMLGLACGSALAVEISDEDYKILQDYKKSQAEKKLPPHEKPAKVEPSGHSHGNLAEQATNPIANLIQFQVQDAYSWKNHVCRISGYTTNL